MPHAIDTCCSVYAPLCRKIQDIGRIRLSLVVAVSGNGWLQPFGLEREFEDSALIHHKDDTISFCKTLMTLGCRVTIEHFGENLASLAGLRAIQPHFVKISGKLTKDIHTDKDNQLFVSSLLSIARGLNINVIAELVENEAESVALTQLDVAYQQGFYFAKPTLWQN